MRIRLRLARAMKEDGISEENPEMYLLILQADLYYTVFLKRVLEDNGALSPSQILAFSVGSKVLVIGEGKLQASGMRGIPIKSKVERMFDRVLSLKVELMKLVVKLEEEYSSR